MSPYCLHLLEVTEDLKNDYPMFGYVVLDLLRYMVWFLLIIEFLTHMATHYQLTYCVHTRLGIITLVKTAAQDRHYT